MAVFPEKMDKLDPNDTVGSFRRIENYIHYMSERMEFASQNTNRVVGDTGTTTAEILIILLNLTSAMSNIQSTINAMREELDALTERVTLLETGEGGTEEVNDGSNNE